jgi:hypothetical protein
MGFRSYEVKNNLSTFTRPYYRVEYDGYQGNSGIGEVIPSRDMFVLSVIFYYLMFPTENRGRFYFSVFLGLPLFKFSCFMP